MFKFLIFTILILGLVHSQDINYLVFSVECPGTICQSQNCQSQYMGNINGSQLTIHGLWPEWSSFCDTDSNDYADDLISSSVLEQLDTCWVGLYNPTSTFRNHEWTKHGECVGTSSSSLLQAQSFIQTQIAKTKRSLQTVDSQMNSFFETVLEIYNGLQISELVFQQSSWAYCDLNDAISQAYNITNFNLMCVNDSNGNQLLQEVQICVDTSFNPITCPNESSSTYLCQDADIQVPSLDLSQYD